MEKIAAEKLVKSATLFSVVLASFIVIAKLAIWILTDSLSILSSLVDSSLDVIASMVNFFAVRYALRPADDDHRFGHGKAEDIAAFAQSAFIMGSGVFIVIEAIHRFTQPQPIVNESWGVWLMIVVSFLTVFLVLFQSYVVKKTRSVAVKADSIHYKMDLLVNAMVVASLVIVMYSKYYQADTLIASFIAIYIFKSAWGVGKEAFDKLMDKEMGDDDRKKITEAIFSHPKIKGMHDLRTRLSGSTTFIQFHLEMDKDISLFAAHEISDEIEGKILKIFPHAEIFVHEDIEDKEEISLEMGRVVPAKK